MFANVGLPQFNHSVPALSQISKSALVSSDDVLLRLKPRPVRVNRRIAVEKVSLHLNNRACFADVGVNQGIAYESLPLKGDAQALQRLVRFNLDARWRTAVGQGTKVVRQHAAACLIRAILRAKASVYIIREHRESLTAGIADLLGVNVEALLPLLDVPRLQGAGSPAALLFSTTRWLKRLAAGNALWPRRATSSAAAFCAAKLLAAIPLRLVSLSTAIAISPFLARSGKALPRAIDLILRGRVDKGEAAHWAAPPSLRSARSATVPLLLSFWAEGCAARLTSLRLAFVPPAIAVERAVSRLAPAAQRGTATKACAWGIVDLHLRTSIPGCQAGGRSRGRPASLIPEHSNRNWRLLPTFVMGNG